jgi:membrane fusion protein, multidrug efflux system
MHTPQALADAPRSFRRSALLICPFLALAFISLGCKRTPVTEPDPPPAPVKWEGARQLFLEEWTDLAGTTQPLPDQAARVTSPVAGRVLAVLPANGSKTVVEGQMVEEGDVLVRLDAEAIVANLAKAEAAKGVLTAEGKVAAKEADKAALELQQLEELKRKDGQSSLVPAIMLERAKLALEAAKASLNVSASKVEAANKELAALKLELDLYTLKAPRKGRLGRIQVVLGQTLPAGAVVAEVVNIENEIDVLCFVSGSEARKLQIGQPARIGGFAKNSAPEAAADPEGKVVYIAEQAEPETGLFAVKVRFPNNDMKLRASAVVRVRILTKPGKACWAVPESALQEDQDPPSIVIVEPDEKPKKNADGKEEQTGKARRVRAVIGMRDRVLHQVEILSLEDPEKKWHGDLENALIIVEKGQSLQTGDAVKLEEEEEEEGAKPPEKQQ